MANGWCVDFTNLNNARSEDSYPLPNINTLVDNALGYELLSFMDAYFNYNQIKMHMMGEEKTIFIGEKTSYCENMMPFRLKNVGATY